MRFSVTHPLVRHPHHPDLVTGEGVRRLAAAVERAGFHGFGFTDHPAPSQRWLDAGGHDALDPFVGLAYVAACTTELRLIPNILVLPYRNPLLVAKAGASLDALSGGRFTLAVGAGYLRAEFAALGVDVDERNDLFDEALAAITALWSTDDVTFDGRHFTARGITAHPRPGRRPPIWIGGNSGRARQRVADAGDGWVPFPAPATLARTARTSAITTVDDLAVAVADLHRRLEAAGRDPGAVDVTFTCTAGGDPAGDHFDPAAHLEGLDRLAGVGVTWVQVGLPGDDVGRAVETAARYGEEVIGPAGGRPAATPGAPAS